MLGFFLAVLCGICTAIGGVGYKVGENGGVRTLQTSAMLGFSGLLFFGFRAFMHHEFTQAPWEIWVLALLVGLFQCMGVFLQQRSFELGPLSLVWCAASLQFMPGLLFAHFVYGEPLTFSNIISLVLIFGAILSASFGGNRSGQEKKGFSLLFALLLAGMLLSYSSIGIALKAAYYMHGTLSLSKLAAGGITDVLRETYSVHGSQSWLELGPNLLMAIVYAVIMAFGSLQLSLHRAWCWNRYAWYGGGMLSIGLLSAFALQISIMGLPGVLVFALSYSVSILMTALISTFLMGEKRTVSWYTTLACSLGAVLLMLV